VVRQVGDVRPRAHRHAELATAAFLRLYGTGRRTTALAAALEAGFGSYAQFYRVFRQQAGRSPSALRTAATENDLNLGGDQR
jgi:AraC-like DNA-binding protein